MSSNYAVICSPKSIRCEEINLFIITEVNALNDASVT